MSIGRFIEKIIEYDMASISRGVKKYVRVRVKLDVQKPLKRKKKIATRQNN